MLAKELIADFPPGPLDYYRKNATFDWKQLKLLFDTEDIVKYQNELQEELQSLPAFQTNQQSLTFDEERRLASRQSLVLQHTEMLSLNYKVQNFKKRSAANRILFQISICGTIKHVARVLFRMALKLMGTQRHEKFTQDDEEGNIYGSYCMTEIGHGSNIKGMRTTATYDKTTKQFILHTPDFEAAKCWIASLGQTATHGIVYAQLIINDECYGLHAFVVPFRDTKTLLSFSGVLLVDMGEKIGLNGVDNGYVIFNNYRIPRENLLNKIGDVTEEGQYVTPIKDKNKRHGASLGPLSFGRVTIVNMCESLGVKALTTAIRYAGVRKQFGPDGKVELPILEYQTHQHRLLPYLAAAYAIRNFGTYFVEVFYQHSLDMMCGNNRETCADLGLEIHVLSSAAKPLAGWTMRDAIQECREASGGHGYLKAAGLGDIRNDHDATLTFEGENYVLIQQTSNWLLKMWSKVLKREVISTPLHSGDFLSSGLDILLTCKFTSDTIEDFCQPKNILKTFQWITCFLMKKSYDKYEDYIQQGVDVFTAKNNCQVFHGKNASLAFIQHFVLQRMLVLVNEATDPNIKSVLLKLFNLYGAWCLEKYLPTLYEGGFASGAKPTCIIQDAILKLCGELKNDAVALVDVIAPPDFILNSALGVSDGQVYHHLQSAMLGSPFAFGRPAWWQDFNNWKKDLQT